MVDTGSLPRWDYGSENRGNGDNDYDDPGEGNSDVLVSGVTVVTSMSVLVSPKEDRGWAGEG